VILFRMKRRLWFL